jgi:dipeptidyl aminopeptidase/acylaminoacyl peptidase
MKSKYYLFGLFLLFSTACGSYETGQEEHPLYSIDQFYENEQIYGGSFSHDGEQLLVTSKATGILNAHALATDGSANIALTESSTESAFAVSFFPQDNRILYRMDEGGNENNRLIMLDETGNSKDLITGDSVRNQFGGWSRDLARMFYLSNKRDKRFMDMYQMSVASMDEELPIGEMIYQNNDGLNIGSMSTNERYYVLTGANTSADNDMYLYDRETNETVSLSEQEEDALFSPQFFDIEDKYLYYTTDLDNEYTYLARYSMEDGSTEKVFETDWDVRYAYESYNGKYRVVGVNEDARTQLFLTDQTTGEEVVLPDVNGDITSVSISRNEEQIRLTVSASTSPSNIYVYNFESQELTKLTDTLNPDLDESSLVSAEVVRFKSFDGLEIPAIYYQPKTASSSNKVPGLVWVHGGPGGQSRTGYSSLIQYLTNQGYAVLAVNNRGSSGYGKTFNQMDNQNHGDKDLKDCIAGKSFFESTGVIDMEKVGIIGGSYGGYMTMAALTFTPRRI